MLSLCSHLSAGHDLDTPQVEAAVAQLVDPGVTDAAKADFLRALRAKGETSHEIAAFARSLLARAVDPGLEPALLPGPMLDVCGTGGDRLELFNISTAAMFILAAGGVCVVKHGNRAMTSKSGSSDVLEAMGIRVDLEPAQLEACVMQHGFGFLFAPLYHPAFKAIAPVRRALAAEGIATIFNLLGPLLNPARPAYQLIGVFSPILLPKYASALAELGRAKAWVVHGSGMDELSLCGPREVFEVSGATISELRIDPRDLGLEFCALEDLRGAGPQENARILQDIIEGADRSARRDIVLLNAAAGFLITGVVPDLAAGVELGRRQIASGRARAKLDALRSVK